MFENIFIKHKVWLFLTVCLFFSYVILQFGGDLSPILFFKWIIYFTMPSIPIFLWIYWREKNSYKLLGKVETLMSVITFILYPLILDSNFFGYSLLNIFKHKLFGLPHFRDHSYLSLILVFIILEIVLRLKNSSEKQLSFIWLKRMTPFLWVSISVAFLSLLFPLMNNFFVERIRSQSLFFKLFYYAFCSLQLFIIYMSYYLYYKVHYGILFERLLKRKGIIYYGMGIILVLLIVVPLHNFIISFFPVVSELKLHSMGLQSEILNDFNFSIPLFVLTITFPFILLQEWYKKSNTIKELEKQKSEAELSLLKEQINPHFFFNTLNNLYSMSLTKDEKTPQVILQLSELMRYVIYKGKAEQVRLQDELNYIKDYVELQSIRLHKEFDFKFDITVRNEDWLISPLLLIIFVENAFKHGIELAEKESSLHLNVLQIGDTLEFTCVNSLEGSTVQNQTGIGLENLRKRLSILYPDKYIIQTQSANGSFKAYLKISNE